MASYSYKELCYQIPEHINKAFVDEFKREPDGDPGYDGDYWTLAAMYVEDLIKQRDELLAALNEIESLDWKRSLKSLDRPTDFAERQAALSSFGEAKTIARKAITKAKVGAVNHFPDAAKMVPDGWRLVPVEPTEEMVNSGHAAWSDGEDDFQSFAMAYGAMLAAAPKFEGGAA